MKVITAIIAWGINKVIKGITVTALIALRNNNEKKTIVPNPRELSETCVPKGSRRSESCSKGQRPFKVRQDKVFLYSSSFQKSFLILKSLPTVQTPFENHF